MSGRRGRAPRHLTLFALALVGVACRRETPAPPAPVIEAVAAAAPAPAPSPPPAWTGPGADIPKIDVHMHIAPDGIAHAVALMTAWGIDHGVNLSGGSPRFGLEKQLAAAARAGGRLSVFCNL